MSEDFVANGILYIGPAYINDSSSMYLCNIQEEDKTLLTGFKGITEYGDDINIEANKNYGFEDNSWFLYKAVDNKIVLVSKSN